MQRDLHLSDEELLMAIDGELKSGNTPAHLHCETCAHCRSRAARFQRLTAEVAAAQQSVSSFPPIAAPRALLRSRMAQEPARKLRLIASLRHSAGLWVGAFGVAALVAVAAVAAVLAYRTASAPALIQPLAASDRAILPNPDYTPGVARPASLQQVCALQHEEVIKEVSPSLRQKVFQEYGIPSAKANEYEVDYLITPGLGGDDDIRNLWPQPYRSATWNAHTKDALEERLHQMVCAHQLDLSVAQHAIATDWIAAYQKYVASLPAPADGAKEL